MVVGESKRANIMDGIENTGDVRLHDHRLRLKQRFDIVRKLGQGTYGKVQLGINKKTGQEVAIKTIKKCKIESEADLVRIRREVQIMSSVRHPNIVHIYEVFENSEKMILVMEYCSGGELYDYLSQKKVMEEEEARRLFRQIATAVYYCHIHKICHRDLKLENVLLDDTGSAKIADFGLSNVFKETSLLSTFCGSPLYASPEIVKGTPYIGPEVDCWSLGVLLYTLVYGAMPFDGSNFKRLVRQISNGDYYEPKNPSTASPLIRDMLTVDPVKRADIAYICDHPWVNTGCETSCLEVSQALAAQTPVRLDLLLSLAPAAPARSNSVVVPSAEHPEMGGEESCTDLTSSASMAVEPSNSAEKRILDLVAEGGEDAIKPSPTRTIVSAEDKKRKLQASSSGLVDRKKERLGSCASIAPPVPEETGAEAPSGDMAAQPATPPTQLRSSATITIQPSPPAPATPTSPPPLPTTAPPTTPPFTPELVRDATREIKETPKELPKEEEPKEKTGAKPRVVIKKKVSPPKAAEEKSEKAEEAKEEAKPTSVASAADRLTSLSLTQQTPAPLPAPTNATLNQAPVTPKPKKFSIPGGNVGSFKEQFERRASLTSAPDVKKTITKPVVSKIAKPKAQSEDRDLPSKTPDNGTVRLQQIGIQPSPAPLEEPERGGLKKTESEPAHGTPASADHNSLLQDARRSLQNSMAKLVEEKEKAGVDRRRARDIISTAIRTGKPPMPYGRSSSAGVTSLVSPPGTPPAAPPSRVFRTEAQHRVEDHRNRGVSVERIIPINLPEEPASPLSPPPKQTTPAPATPTMGTSPLATPTAARPGPAHQPLRRLVSNESTTSDTCASPGGEPIKKSAREFIIPIAVEGKGYVTPRQRSLEPDTASATRLTRGTKPRRISNLVSGGESEEEDDSHMHRLRSTRAARAESVSSGEEDEEDEGFHLLTAENLFSTLLHRVRALTNRLNGEEGPGFPQHPHSLFNNLSHEPFFNSPHLPRRHLFHHRYVESKRSVSETREGWGSRDFSTDFDSMFSKARAPLPRGNSKKGKHHTKAAQNADTESGLDLSDLDLSAIEFGERELRALRGLTPALSRRLQRQLLAHLPPAAATQLRRTLSLHADTKPDKPTIARSQSVTPAETAETPNTPDTSQTDSKPPEAIKNELLKPPESMKTDNAKTTESIKTDYAKTSESIVKNAPEHRLSEEIELPAPQFCTLPRLKRHSTVSRETTPPSVSDVEFQTRLSPHERSKEPSQSRASSIRSTPDRPLLSKYLTPERTVSLDEPYSSSDGGSILSEPSYIAAYGTPGISGTSSLRRHSMRLAGEQPRKRISRFLRSDFFDTPPDESVYLKHKKEKELETQKILKEIREKKNKALESPNVKSPTEASDAQTVKDDGSYTRKCLSPISILTGKERSRSNTPFFPSLDGIKENTLDMSLTRKDSKRYSKTDDVNDHYQTIDSTKDAKLMRPKSYPVKDSFDEHTDNRVPENNSNKENEVKEKTLPRESKLIRPKSYPTSSPSPEKVFINRNVKKEETKRVSTTQTTQKEDIKTANEDIKTDVEVSFSITLPKKSKTVASSKTDTLRKTKSLDQENDNSKSESINVPEHSLTLKKYQIVSGPIETKTDKERKTENGSAIANGITVANAVKSNTEESKTTTTNNVSKVEEVKSKGTENEPIEKKQGTLKKKIIKKVSSKSKADAGTSQEGTDAKPTTEKKKVTKKVKEKTADDGTKTATVTKKKSVLQSIGHKLEKFTSNKSSSPEKVAENVSNSETKKDTKISRTQREQSVPVNAEPPTESNLIKRAVTLTDVAALDTQNTTPSKTTVSKVLGLFKKFEPKEKVPKQTVEKSNSENLEANVEKNSKNEFSSQSAVELESDRPRRPTSLLLNGLGRKTKYGRNASDSVTAINLDNDDETSKKETTSKNIRNSLKLDFSRLPRVKKIVPTNPVIEPQLMNVSSDDKDFERKDIQRNGTATNDSYKILVRGDENESHSRSRSRSRSTFSNSEQKSENSAEVKYYEKNPLSPTENNVHHPVRNHESTTPEKEDIVERIRRKSFYSRFNEKKQRRKSNLVGPGATEYDPLARIHAPPSASETKVDTSPTSPISYDLSPGYSIASDLSPSTDRYRSLLTDLPVNSRNNLRFENYGLNDKIDTYRSLDRNEFRKYPGTRSYLDYDQPSSYTSHRYSRTKSLLDSSDGIEDHSHSSLRDPHLYNRTISMYAPGSYATYRPKRTLNPAIILKESEKEKSPENILEKIRHRKNFSIRVTRKPDPEKDPLPRSDGPPKGEGDSSERSEKVD